MGYYTRIFCKSNHIPAFSELQQYLVNVNVNYKLDATVDDNNKSWTDIEFFYKEGKLPVLVEVNWIDNEGSIGQEEIEEFLEEIGSPGLSLRKRKVIQHLKQTRYIICNQLPTSDMDDDGYNANSEFLKFFADNYEGMIHADGEGFYKDGVLILKDE